MADTGSGGLFNATTPLVTGAFIDKMPPATSYAFPYIVLASRIAGGPHAFQKDVCKGDVQVHMFVAEDDASGDPWQKLSDIETRVKGDSSAGVAPSYGLHRHPLALSAGSWTSTTLIWNGTDPEPEGDNPVIHYVMFFECNASR